MTLIDRTAYPGFSRAPQPKELIELYTPTPTDVAFVSIIARGPSQKLALMILLKVFQKLGYFPASQQIPGAIISHIHGEMEFPKNLVLDITQLFAPTNWRGDDQTVRCSRSLCHLARSGEDLTRS